MGTNYTVQTGDTCQAVAASNSTAIDRLIAANGLPYNCKTLNAGIALCLGPSCTLQDVQPNQTCSDIVSTSGFSVVQLTSWNPTIHMNCDNLDGMVGRSICVLPPGTTSYQESSMSIAVSSTITPMFSGPWVTGTINTAPATTNTSWFNTETNFTAPAVTTYVYNSTRASLVADITTLCPIQPSDVDNGWTLSDLPDACEDLLDPYCYPDLNQPSPSSTTFPAVCSPAYYSTVSSTSTSPGNSAPTPLEPGTISSCTQYYQVLDGDTCYSISTHYGVTLDQFYTWNPSVGSSCADLYIGYYVCVQA